MFGRVLLVIALVVVLLAVFTATAAPAPQDDHADPGILTAINTRLATRGVPYRAEEIDFFTLGESRPSNRVHQQEFRWVPNDARRLAQDNDITYLVDSRYGRTASGLRSTETEAAIDRAMSTWDVNSCTSNFDIIKRSGRGDVTIFDWFYGYGGYGDPYVADIVNAGWYPRDYFEAVGGPGGGRGILAFSVSFVFTEDDGTPTDIDGNNYLDTALNEVYYNDTFGDRRTDRAGNPWVINLPLPGIDVETVALHENGHSLGLGHFGPPPTAVMNPRYGGILHEPLSADEAGMCAIWSSWPSD